MPAHRPNALSHVGLYKPLQRLLRTVPTTCRLAMYAGIIDSGISESWIYFSRRPPGITRDADDLPRVLRSVDISPLPLIVQVEAKLGRYLTGLSETYWLAMWAVDVMTDIVRASEPDPIFGPDQYAYLKGALNHTARRGSDVLEKNPDLNAVRNAHHSLCNELSEVNLQARVRGYLAQAGEVPVMPSERTPCPLCVALGGRCAD